MFTCSAYVVKVSQLRYHGCINFSFLYKQYYIYFSTFLFLFTSYFHNLTKIGWFHIKPIFTKDPVGLKKFFTRGIMLPTVDTSNRRSTKKLDLILEIESSAREKWEEERIFEADAPKLGSGESFPEKFHVSVPFPYMNGLLHLGHAFTFTKMEFLANYKRLQGKRTLFPIGFHVTGMPIKAAADKIKREVEDMGEDFINKNVNQISAGKDDDSVGAAKSKPSKVLAKKTNCTYQYEILLSMGIPLEDIHKFADPIKWLEYFPIQAMEDLKALGMGIDWRRSTITTEKNPYYDSFVKWTLRKLYNSPKEYIMEGEKPTIYSPIDKQPCLDHDRSSGEGVGYQEYDCVKIEVDLIDVELNVKNNKYTYKDKIVGAELIKKLLLLEGKKLFLVCATFRPETFYGQVSCYVSTKITYCVFASSNNEAYICTKRSGRNMAYQCLLETPDEMRELFTIDGSDLVGLSLIAPISHCKKIYVLPMDTIKDNIGTAIVASIPSDSPDDLINLRTLAKKCKYYGIHEDWVLPFVDNYPRVIKTRHGDSSASYCLEHYKITSPNETAKLEESKVYIYKLGYTEGVMVTGEYEEMPVTKAKPLIRQKLIDSNKAFTYYEPSAKIISRSGCECVVKPCHQWFYNYGAPEWKSMALECLDSMKFYNNETYNAFKKNFDWLGPWALSRTFGLGSRVPWDSRYVVESLSDSVLHMAYYTVSHYLHSNSMDGSVMGIAQITPESMDDKFWDYIMFDTDYSEDIGVKKDILDEMRNEFRYFYPMDIRSSGKDLIFNHLSFCIYAHTALFPKERWPKCFYTNGHTLLNGEKMSKSTGNFLTIRDCLKLYGADATRLTLADSGDSMDDANFVLKVAEDTILKLYTDITLAKKLQQGLNDDIYRKGEYNIADKSFLVELANAVRNTETAYEALLMRDCVKYSFYGLPYSFVEYRKLVDSYYPPSDGPQYSNMHTDLVRLYLRVTALINSPICPHTSEYIWSTLLKNDISVRNSRWPFINITKEQEKAYKAYKFVDSLISRVRSEEEALMRKQLKKNKLQDASEKVPLVAKKTSTASKSLHIMIVNEYPYWCHKLCSVIKKQSHLSSDGKDVNINELISTAGVEKNKQTVSQLVQFMCDARANNIDPTCNAYPINQSEAIENFKLYILSELSYLSINSIHVHVYCYEKKLSNCSSEIRSLFQKKNEPYPGIPNYLVVTTD